MTQTTDKNRAEFLAWVRTHEECHGAIDEGSAWAAWQAARRAPVVPIDNEKLSEISERFAALICEKRRLHISRGMDAGAEYYIRDVANYVAHAVNNAAAPQPPEAAPVQLPDPAASAYMSEPKDDGTVCTEMMVNPGFCTTGWNMLYTEHQVRQLLAAHAHGITQAKQGGADA